MNGGHAELSYRNATKTLSTGETEMTAAKMMNLMDRTAMTVAVLLASLPILTVVAGASIL